MAFRKVRFSNGASATPGLVFDSDTLATKTVCEISRCFPYWESLKMRRLETSPPFDTWEGAFYYEF
jgi:hypothetical protein